MNTVLRFFFWQTFHGVFYHYENSADGILEILKELDKYVPFTGEDKQRIYCDQGAVGDQLTVSGASSEWPCISQ